MCGGIQPQGVISSLLFLTSVVRFLCFEFFSDNPGKLQLLANLPLDAPLWVQIGKQDELAEADLKYVGPLTRGSSAVIFGVQLKVNLNQGYL